MQNIATVAGFNTI